MIKYNALLSIFVLIAGADDENSSPSVALCYANDPPIAKLSIFDWVVVDPDAKFHPLNSSDDSDTVWLAYLSVGEVGPWRSYYEDIPKSWLIGDNTEWEAKIVNQTAQGWPEFFIANITTPIWSHGFKGFFLDTLDSYQRVTKNDAQRKEQEAGLVHVIQMLKSKYPDAIIISNRGFEIMSSIHSALNMVAFESLFSGWNQAKKEYVAVNQNDRDWLMARTHEIQNQYSLPVLAIDYYPSDNKTWGQNVARQIVEQGVTPYVTDPLLQTVGIGTPNMNE